MDHREADKAAILAVMKAETAAWLRRDFEAQAKHWVHSPEARLMTAFTSLGIRVIEGWDAIGSRMKRMMERFSEQYDIGRLRWENVNIVLSTDMAWVSYDQIGTDTGDDFEMAGVSKELKIFHRIDGAWKIGCLVLLQHTVDHVAAPLIEVAPDARIAWMNRQAEARMRSHPGLRVVNGRLRARRRECQAALADAMRWAFRELEVHVPPKQASGQVRAVHLGEDDTATPLYCWIVIEDGKTLVSFDDVQMVARRIGLAAEAYRLSPAQMRLARLIVDGNDLAAAAEVLGISVNTVRTQLQRMFDKTGTRSQATLVRALLGPEAPTK